MNKKQIKIKNELILKSLKKRHQKSFFLKSIGVFSIIITTIFITLLVFTIIMSGKGAFYKTFITLDVNLNSELLRISGDNEKELNFNDANYNLLLKKSLYKIFPEIKNRKDKKLLFRMISSNSEFLLKDYLQEHPHKLNQSVKLNFLVSDSVNLNYRYMIKNGSFPSWSTLTLEQKKIFTFLKNNNYLQERFNFGFFLNGDSRNPESAGLGGAIVGSFLTLAHTFVFSFPIGLLTAVYLEEYAKEGRITDIIETNINNLASVPSIIFGLLGLAIFLNVFNLPRSSPLVGALVLTLMTLPTIIISSRSALQSVPHSYREAAYGIGASKIQVILFHVLPQAFPGIFTGVIIGMAQALGETAPLLLIGMVAFVVEIPSSIMDVATVLPVQIFLWSNNPERGFTENTAGAIIVLLMFLFIMNIAAILLRNKMEQKK